MVDEWDEKLAAVMVVGMGNVKVETMVFQMNAELA